MSSFVLGRLFLQELPIHNPSPVFSVSPEWMFNLLPGIIITLSILRLSLSRNVHLLSFFIDPL